MAPSRTHRRLARALAAAAVAALALASPAAAATGRMLLDDAPVVGAIPPGGGQAPEQPGMIQRAITGTINAVVDTVLPGPNRHHANPPMCWGDTVTAYEGQNLDQIADGLASGCVSTQAFYEQLCRLNPQLPTDGTLVAGDAICFPIQMAQNINGAGRRLLEDQMVGAVAPDGSHGGDGGNGGNDGTTSPADVVGAVAPGGNHAWPANCPQGQVGYAEAGDRLWSVAEAYHCQNSGGWKPWIAGKLTTLNPQIPSLWTPLFQGDVICTSVWTCPF